MNAQVNTPEGGEPQDFGFYRADAPLRCKLHLLPGAFLFGPGLIPASAKAAAGAFAMEIGLRLGDARVRCVFVHAGAPSELLKLTVIREADGDEQYAEGRPDLWTAAADDPIGPWIGRIERYHVDEKCWVNSNESVGETKAQWSDSPLRLQARPGGLFASDAYLKLTLDGNVRIAAPARWAIGDPKQIAVEWAPKGSGRCLVARVEAFIGDDSEPMLTSFLVESLELSEWRKHHHNGHLQRSCTDTL